MGSYSNSFIDYQFDNDFWNLNKVSNKRLSIFVSILVISIIVLGIPIIIYNGISVIYYKIRGH